jgi:hypothetical protein
VIASGETDLSRPEIKRALPSFSRRKAASALTPAGSAPSAGLLLTQNNVSATRGNGVEEDESFILG